MALDAKLAALQLDDPVGHNNGLAQKPVGLIQEDIYEAEAILCHRVGRGHIKEYFVAWKGYSSSEWSWVRRADCSRALLRCDKLNVQLTLTRKGIRDLQRCYRGRSCVRGGPAPAGVDGSAAQSEARSPAACTICNLVQNFSISADCI